MWLLGQRRRGSSSAPGQTGRQAGLPFVGTRPNVCVLMVVWRLSDNQRSLFGGANSRRKVSHTAIDSPAVQLVVVRLVSNSTQLTQRQMHKNSTRGNSLSLSGNSNFRTLRTVAGNFHHFCFYSWSSINCSELPVCLSDRVRGGCCFA